MSVAKRGIRSRDETARMPLPVFFPPNTPTPSAMTLGFNQFSRVVQLFFASVLPGDFRVFSDFFGSSPGADSQTESFPPQRGCSDFRTVWKMAPSGSVKGDRRTY